jgi:hypothetical protein
MHTMYGVMPRPTFLKRAKRVTFTIESALHKEAVKKARNYGFQGGFSEYVSRLLIADQRSKAGLARNTPRSFRQAEATETVN